MIPAMIYGGIDPGKDGAISWTDGEDVVVRDVPMLTEAGKKRAYDTQGMRDLLEEAARRREHPEGNGPRVLFVIEAQQAMPGQGVTSMFSIGLGYGLWLGLLAGLQIPYRVVHPVSWKKALMAGEPRTAQASVAVALRHYPTLRHELVGPKGGLKDGRADALLLAHYGRQIEPAA